MRLFAYICTRITKANTDMKKLLTTLFALLMTTAGTQAQVSFGHVYQSV